MIRLATTNLNPAIKLAGVSFSRVATVCFRRMAMINPMQTSVARALKA